MKISGIGFENFRIFRERCDFDLAPITVLTGANSSGKSTVIKALKLFQRFWENPKGQYQLDFTEGSHQLGDFEMSLSKHSDNNKDFIVRYYIKDVLFGNLCVENKFVIDESNKMRNGRLLQSCIFQDSVEEPVLLYRTQDDGKSLTYFWNMDEIIKTVIPRRKELEKECIKFLKKARKYLKKYDHSIGFGSVTDFGDYTGEPENTITLGYIYPAITQKFCDHLGVDFQKYKELDDYIRIFSSAMMYGHQDGDEDANKIIVYLEHFNSDYLYDSKILRLIAKINVDQYDKFEEVLWMLIVQHYPEVQSYCDYHSFKKIIEEIENNYPNRDWNEMMCLNKSLNTSRLVKRGDCLWRKVIKKKITTNFDAFYKDLEKEYIKDIALIKCESFDDGTIEEHFPEDSGIHLFSKKRQWHINLNLNPKGETEEINLHFFETGETERETLMYILNYLIGIEKHLFNDDARKKFHLVNVLINNLRENLNDLTYKRIEAIFSAKIKFIESIRANTQRMYTYTSQGTTFNDFLLEYMNCKWESKHKKFLTKWIEEFGIGKKIEFRQDSGVGFKIIVEKEDHTKENLVDLGYGVTQFLPILMNIVYCANQRKTTFVIEEPETNLHPKFQSKIADMFVDAYKTFGISFIVETHSEYFIRKLQYLTAKGEITPDDTAINYVGKPDPDERDYGEEQVRKIRIKRNGQLSQPFGSGFTDESSHWIKEMFTYSSHN